MNLRVLFYFNVNQVNCSFTFILNKHFNINDIIQFLTDVPYVTNQCVKCAIQTLVRVTYSRSNLTYGFAFMSHLKIEFLCSSVQTVLVMSLYSSTYSSGVTGTF